MPTNNRSTSQTVRRAQVASACESCRLSKVKCSGKHPTCARCTSRGTECRYDVLEEGMTRREYLRHELTGQKQELDRKTTILRVMQLGSDQEATEMLARLRMGMSVDEAYDQLFEGSQNRELYGVADGESIDAASTASGAVESPSLMEDISSDIATAGSMAGEDDGDAAERDGMLYSAASAASEGQQATPMETVAWEDYHLYTPFSTCSLADVNRSPELSNIDPALQTSSQQSAATGRSSSYSPRRGGL